MVRSTDQHIHYKYGAKRKAERRYVHYAVIRRTKNFLTKQKPRRTLRTTSSYSFHLLLETIELEFNIV